MAVTSCFLQGKWLLPSKQIVDILYQEKLRSLHSTEPCWVLTDFQASGSGVGTAAAGLEEGQPDRTTYLAQYSMSSCPSLRGKGSLLSGSPQP